MLNHTLTDYVRLAFINKIAIAQWNVWGDTKHQGEIKHFKLSSLQLFLLIVRQTRRFLLLLLCIVTFIDWWCLLCLSSMIVHFTTSIHHFESHSKLLSRPKVLSLQSRPNCGYFQAISMIYSYMGSRASLMLSLLWSDKWSSHCRIPLNKSIKPDWTSGEAVPKMRKSTYTNLKSFVRIFPIDYRL